MRFYNGDPLLPTARPLVVALAGLLSLVVAGSGHAQAPQSTITTVAGNGTAGYVAAQDGGPARMADLDEPCATAVDDLGNLYIADRANHRIRRVDASTGIITTVAGNGTAGYNPLDEGAPAAAASLNGPRGIALDRSGNLYIADTRNHRVRRVDTTGAITTVAGTGVAGYSPAQENGPATAALLDSPQGLAVSATGDLFIADYNNQRIRRVALATGLITTVAGTGSAGYVGAQDGGPGPLAELNYPTGVALDRAGNLFIADTDNQRIRRVDAATGRISTVAGNGLAGYSPADEFVPATRSSLNTPTSIAVDSAGNLYIADATDSRIRRLDAQSGTITTIAGNGVAGYIASQDGSAAANARLNHPRGVTVDRVGHLYIADAENHRIRRVELPATGTLFLAGK